MKIVLENIGKRFNREWIFRNVSYEFFSRNKYSILGTNGTGKSTLLQIIAGSLSQSEGEIKSEVRSQKSEVNNQQQEFLFKNISYAAPYLELPEEMTWKEAVKFQGKFKRFLTSDEGQGTRDEEEKIIELSGLQSSAEKQIRNFSSGMKQRAKLALAILSDTPLLLLDEPTTNLDESGVKWYQDLIAQYAKEKLVIVCSNYNKEEYSFCDKELVLKSY
ncbi:MAG: ABC transporter ATP-binding protein [Bacteroidetes bacterium]|nr:ABC transporter ATP-binding protein [Bacteroidota bacterium]